MKDLFELDRMKVQWYNEFYDKNQQLYEHNRGEFFHEQRMYVEKRLQEYNLRKKKLIF